MPFLSMVRMAAAETRSFTQRFSLATQKRRSCRLGRKRRRALLLAWETLLPVLTRLPVTWQVLDMAHLESSCCRPWPGRRRPRRATGGRRAMRESRVRGAGGEALRFLHDRADGSAGHSEPAIMRPAPGRGKAGVRGVHGR